MQLKVTSKLGVYKLYVIIIISKLYNLRNSLFFYATLDINNFDNKAYYAYIPANDYIGTIPLAISFKVRVLSV